MGVEFRHKCFHILVGCALLLTAFLIITAIVRVILDVHAKKQHSVIDERALIDLLIVDLPPHLIKNVTNHLSALCDLQLVKSEPGMIVLVALGSEDDGIYIVDQDLTMVRTQSIESDQEYLVKIGKHAGITWSQSKPETSLSHQTVFHAKKTDTTLFLSAEEAIIYFHSGVSTIYLECKQPNALITCVNTNDEPVSIAIQKQKILAQHGVSQFAMMQGNLLIQK